MSAASTAASRRSGSGSRPRPRSPREASRPSSGSITSTPRSRSVARLAWVAASAYMRSFIAGATSRGAVQARKEVVSIESAKPPASLAIVLAEAGATRKASQLAASSRWPIGSWPPSPRLAGEGAAHRVALELGGEHGRADDPLEGGGADEAAGVLGHQDPDAVAGQRRQARELERLVGRYPSADTQQQPGHIELLASRALRA